MAKRKRNNKIKLSGTAIAVLIVIAVIFYIADVIINNESIALSGDCEFHFIDVGQGDSALIISEEGVVVIDAGPQDHAESTLEYIQSYTEEIDYLILTHPHEDHIGGADEIVSNLTVKNVIMSDAYSDTETIERLLDAIEKSGADVIEAKAGDEYTAGGIELTILSPVTEFADFNDYSVVTRVEYGETSAIITGDVEKNSEGIMVERYMRSLLRADIYQVSHHGSVTSNSEEFLDAVSPKYAVIQCGEDNSYGHPHKETVDKLEERGIEYFRTDERGHIVFITDGKELELKGQ
ncbi:MAG: MBL fold metallo-hydrolase [Clostridia bacterium]|nr:MBL fold metallo-hydrolase [Clostridia bacterium]